MTYVYLYRKIVHDEISMYISVGGFIIHVYTNRS